MAEPMKHPHDAIEATDFSDALKWLKRGYRLTRDNWNGPNQYIELQVPDANSKMSLPYIFIRTTDGFLVPWLASQTDLLAADWRAQPLYDESK